MKVSIIVPTYNERDNIPELLRRIDGAMRPHGWDYEVVIVDDNSPDGTAELARQLSGLYPVKVVERPGRLGLASAVVEGVKHADGDFVVVMDADLQHPPEVIPLIVEKLSRCDVVVASRYVEGGGVSGFPWYRRLMSRGAAVIAWLLLPESRKTSDPMSGFFGFKRRVIGDFDTVEPRGYKVLLDLLRRARQARVCDQPYVFVSREKGESKLGLRVVLAHIRHILKLAFFKL
ncbi:family 2 glycosyltransferase [Thermogladius calderae 1633]|uniref:Family 2 glycosyltransferase n=1 Tax=Thermogladius calderae (strain DSM 22663 / VKM B-2946 / 1633) TaxID=1184251 RepID=I3TEW5_THEC1|nr:polyprenol monophosphomannose synthase [Thermogladius calderae]AFK51303.1 family 2 glycosyltransferase [Thermogladius calderae 1633]